MVKISIIIPVYNVENYLSKCVHSVREQSLKDIEIILVDDESPDNSPQMCDNFAAIDKRIKVVHRKNGGLGFARNSGLEVASGKYVTFLDSDDYVDTNTYEHLSSIMDKYLLDALYYKYCRFNSDNEDYLSDSKSDITLYEGSHVKDLMLDLIASEPSAKVDHKIQCSSCTAIYRLDLIKQNKICFHSERELISEDLIFNLDYLKVSKKIAFNESKHYHYRLNNLSLTNTVRTDRVDKNLLLYNYINENLLDWNIDVQLGMERNQRLFIGNTRSSICHFLSSSYINKKEWLNKVLSISIWNELYNNYNWKKLPLFQRVFFFFCCKKCKWGLFLLSSLK